MKRCIICGNVDDDNSTVCSTCGNPYVDMSGRTVGAEESAEQSETEAAPEEAEAAGAEQSGTEEARQEDAAGLEQSEAEAQQQAEEELQQSEAESRQAGEDSQQGETAGAEQAEGQHAEAVDQMSGGRAPRRTRSGPQIYGQAEGPNGNPELYASQGMIRRDVPPRSAGSGRPAGQMGQMPAGAGRPAGQMGQMPQGAGRPAGQDPLARRVIETARKALKSPLFFLIVLLNTLYVASSIAAIFMDELNYSQIVRLLNESNLPQQASGYVSSATTLLQKLDSGMIVANIMLHIPSILFCLGLWLIFITALAAKERMSGVGFGFAKAAVIIRMIVACIVMLAALVITVTVVVAAWVSGEKSVITMAIIMLVITIIIVMMIIMYYFAYLGTLKTCRVNANTGERYGKLSGYLAVLLIIMSLPGIVGLLSGIVNMEISNIVGSIAKMGWMLLFAVWIFLYRGRMSELENQR